MCTLLPYNIPVFLRIPNIHAKIKWLGICFQCFLFSHRKLGKIFTQFDFCIFFKWVGSTTNWDIKKTLQTFQELIKVHGTHDLDNSRQIHRASPHSPPVVFLLGSQLGSFSCLERYVCWDSMMVKPAVYLLLLNLPPRKFNIDLHKLPQTPIGK